MNYQIKRLITIALLSLWLLQVFHLSGQSLPGEIHFVVSMENPDHHCFHVTMQCQDFKEDSLDISMPVWSPGYYLIMDFSKNVLSFKATGDNGNPLEWEKTDKNTWRVRTKMTDSLTVEYDVYAYNISVVDPYLDEDRGFISPAGVFLYIDGMVQHPVTLTIKPYSGFKTISTGLDAVKDIPYTFSAPDFDVFYDCPVLIGNQKILSFDYLGIPHTIAIEDPENIDRERFIRDLKKIVETSVSIIGEIPYKHYTFLMMEHGMGGLEHANSMAVFYNPARLSNEYGHKGNLSFLAHEYFHLYNVKTIRPFSLGPFDYEKENDTRLLWISEGLTVYYENVILNRAGFLNRDECLEEYTNAIKKYENIPGHLFQSAAESGTNAWMQFFNFLDPGKNNTTISYYDKGCALGLLLDLKIRHETRGKKSLDDVMRKLYAEFYKEKKRGFTEQEFRKTCETIAGCSLDEIFTYASTVAEIDYPRYFAFAGLEIDTAWHEITGVYTGIVTHEKDNRLFVSRVIWNSPGWKAGLSPDDEILEINKIPFRSLLWDEVIRSVNQGDTIILTISHRNFKRSIEIITGKKYERNFAVRPMAKPSQLQSEILKGWLTGND